jgi:hypothetical protein
MSFNSGKHKTTGEEMYHTIKKEINTVIKASVRNGRVKGREPPYTGSKDVYI